MAGDHKHAENYGEGPWQDLPSGVQRVAIVDADGSIQSLDAVLPAFHRNYVNEQDEPLGPNEIFTGEWHDFANMPSVIVAYLTDAKPLGVFVEWSSDGETPGTGPLDVSALNVVSIDGIWSVISVQNLPVQRYARLSVLNGPDPQTFVLSMNSCPKASFAGMFLALHQDVPFIAPGLLTRAAVMGQLPNGRFASASLSDDGQLQTRLGSNKKMMLLGTGAPQTVKSSAGVLHKIISTGGPVILGYDDASGVANQFLNISMSNNQSVIDFGGIEFENGLRLMIQSGRTVTVVYS